MSTIRKINGSVVFTRTRHGVRIFRVVRKTGGKLAVDNRFRMRVYRDGRRVYFTLPASLSAAKTEAERIRTFLEKRGNTLDDAVRLFHR